MAEQTAPTARAYFTPVTQPSMMSFTPIRCMGFTKPTIKAVVIPQNAAI